MHIFSEHLLLRTPLDGCFCIKVFFKLNYSGETAERMVKSCNRKPYKRFKQKINVKVVTHNKTTKMLFFANAKDNTPSLSQPSVVYKFRCPS